MKHEDAVDLLCKHLEARPRYVDPCPDPTDPGRQWVMLRTGANHQLWQYCWWRTDESETLTHCGLFDCHPGDVRLRHTATGRLARIGEAIARGWPLEECEAIRVPGPDDGFADHLHTWVDWCGGDFLSLIQFVLSIFRIKEHEIVPGDEFKSMTVSVRPALPELDRLEVLVRIDDSFRTEDVETVNMAVQYLLGVLPFEVFLDWLQQQHPEIAQQIEESQSQQQVRHQ